MATQISCGATDCGNNSGGGRPDYPPTCTLDSIRVTFGKMGGAICSDYSNNPVKGANGQQGLGSLNSGIGAVQR